jgi:hypothetical protein
MDKTARPSQPSESDEYKDEHLPKLGNLNSGVVVQLAKCTTHADGASGMLIGVFAFTEVSEMGWTRRWTESARIQFRPYLEVCYRLALEWCILSLAQCTGTIKKLTANGPN